MALRAIAARGAETRQAVMEAVGAVLGFLGRGAAELLADPGKKKIPFFPSSCLPFFPLPPSPPSSGGDGGRGRSSQLLRSRRG